LAFGRRPVFIASTIILLAALIGAALQNSYSAHLGTRVLQGLATGSTESVLPLILTEISYLADRGKLMGLYWGSQNLLTAVLTITASYEVAALGWRWYYWVFAFTIGAGLIFVLFGAFETSFQRSLVSIDGLVIVTDEFGVTQVVPDDQAQDRLADAQSDHDSESDMPRTSYMQKLKPWSKPRPRPIRIMVTAWLQMAFSLTSPALLYVILISSAALSGTIFQSLTYATTLISLGWSEKSIGLINVGAIVGSVIAMVYCQFISDPLVIWLARRNQGIHKPEHRLVPLVPVVCLGFAMHLVFGFSATSTSAWGTIVSYTLSNAAFIAILIISSTFATEATPKYPGPAIVMVIGSKNIISFGVSHALSGTIGVHPLAWSFGVFAGVYAALALLGVPVYFLNPRWRALNTKMDAKADL
jgi:MFS family permease